MEIIHIKWIHTIVIENVTLIFGMALKGDLYIADIILDHSGVYRNFGEGGLISYILQKNP